MPGAWHKLIYNSIYNMLLWLLRINNLRQVVSRPKIEYIFFLCENNSLDFLLQFAFLPLLSAVGVSQLTRRKLFEMGGKRSPNKFM